MFVCLPVCCFECLVDLVCDFWCALVCWLLILLDCVGFLFLVVLVWFSTCVWLYGFRCLCFK